MKASKCIISAAVLYPLAIASCATAPPETEGKPSAPCCWLLVWPLLLWSNSRDHMRGDLPDYFREAGFRDVRVAGHWKGLLNFWLARKE